MFSNSIGETSSFFLSGETFRLIEACDEKKLRDIDKSLRYSESEIPFPVGLNLLFIGSPLRPVTTLSGPRSDHTVSACTCYLVTYSKQIWDKMRPKHIGSYH
jgi:hypothetical protein